MKRLLRVLGALLAAVVVLVGAALLLIESGEVVVLHSADDRGQVFRSRLWVVDHQGAPWVSTGNPAKDWFVRVRQRPRVELVRGGETSCRQGVVVDDPATRAELRRLFQGKCSPDHVWPRDLRSGTLVGDGAAANTTPRAARAAG